jgi:hypothetical protein
MGKILFAGLVASSLCLDGAAAPNGSNDAVAKAVSSAYTAPAATVTVRDIPLPPELKARLQERLPALRLWRNADYPEAALAGYPYSAGSFPYAVRADFNGDGAEDVVLSGHNGEVAVVIALVSDGTSYQLVGVHSRVGGADVGPRETLVFQKKGCGYSVGDSAPHKLGQVNDGFALREVKAGETYLSGPDQGSTGVYFWNDGTESFRRELLDSSYSAVVLACTSRFDPKTTLFEEKAVPGGNRAWVKGATLKIAVRATSGEWLDAVPKRGADGAFYFKLPAGARARSMYFCLPPLGRVDYWKVKAASSVVGPDDDIPTPVSSRVLPTGTAFGFYWTVPAMTTTTSAVFSYGCDGAVISTVIVPEAIVSSAQSY